MPCLGPSMSGLRAGSGGTAATASLFRGRRWFAGYVWLLGLLCIALGLATPAVDWFAVAVMGPVTLVSGYVCLLIGWGEAVARVELSPAGFDLRLPAYRGYLPSWSVCRLRGAWDDVVSISHRRVRARIIGIRFDYVAHVIATRQGRIMLLEPLRNDFFRNTRGTGLNLPVAAIMAEVARRTGRGSVDLGSADGGGLWRSLTGRGPAATDTPP